MAFAYWGIAREVKKIHSLCGAVLKSSEQRWASTSQASAPYSLKNKGYSFKAGRTLPGSALMGQLRTRLIGNKAAKRWDTRLKFHIPKSEQRVIDRKTAIVNREKRKFNTMVNYILKRRERGF